MLLEANLDRRTSTRKLLLIILIGFMFVVFVSQSSINGSLFVTVKNYVNTDPRCQTYPTYARPNIDNSLGWSIAQYRWRGDWSIDWVQANLFLNELAYYDEQAYWCDYYRIHTDDMQFCLFLWFQIAKTEFVFLHS